MKDFIYDLRRTMTGKFTITAVALIIIISALIGYGFTTLAGGGTGGTSTSVYNSYYYNNASQSYNITFYAFSFSDGQSVNDLNVQTTVNGVNNTLITNAQGYAYLNYSSTKSEVNLTYTGYVFSSSTGTQTTQNNMPMYSNNSLHSSYFQLQTFVKPGTKNVNEILVFYDGNTSALAPTTYIYYKVVNGTSSGPSNYKTYATTQMTLYGKLNSGYRATTVYVNPSNYSSSSNQYVTVELFNSTGANATLLTAIQGYQPVTTISTITLAQISFTIYGLVFGFVIPFLAALSAYFYFGKDKASGVLESVVTRPVTKGRLIMSRYIANVGSLMIGLAIGVTIFEVFMERATGSFMPMDYTLSLLWVYLIEIGAFTGIVYILSQFLKSQGAILGIGIGLTILFALVWNGIITPLVLTFVIHAVSGTNAYYYYSIVLDALNPSDYGTLVILFLVSTAHVSVLNSGILDVTKYGITRNILATIGLLWLLVPIAIAFVFGRKRD